MKLPVEIGAAMCTAVDGGLAEGNMGNLSTCWPILAQPIPTEVSGWRRTKFLVTA